MSAQNRTPNDACAFVTAFLNTPCLYSWCGCASVRAHFCEMFNTSFKQGGRVGVLLVMENAARTSTEAAPTNLSDFRAEPEPLCTQADSRIELVLGRTARGEAMAVAYVSHCETTERADGVWVPQPDPARTCVYVYELRAPQAAHAGLVA